MPQAGVGFRSQTTDMHDAHGTRWFWGACWVRTLTSKHHNKHNTGVGAPMFLTCTAARCKRRAYLSSVCLRPIVRPPCTDHGYSSHPLGRCYSWQRPMCPTPATAKNMHDLFMTSSIQPLLCCKAPVYSVTMDCVRMLLYLGTCDYAASSL